jgi:hypothetical protein
MNNDLFSSVHVSQTVLKEQTKAGFGGVDEEENIVGTDCGDTTKLYMHQNSVF